MTDVDIKGHERTNATVKDVAEHFDVSERTVRRWMKNTDIPYRRIENTIRFNMREVEDWAAANAAEDGEE